MSYLTYYKKRPTERCKKLASRRNRNKVIDFQVTKNRDFSSYLIMARRVESKYNINYLCADGYEAYSKYSISIKHTTTKAETSVVESFNALIKHYLARFNRKTKRYSKKLDMIFHPLVPLFHKSILSIIT